MVVFGAHAFVWGTTSTVVRQRAVPDELLGRVGGVYRVAIVGGLVIGTPLGGVLASAYGITAPFWFGFVGSALLVAVLWRQFSHIAPRGTGLGARLRSRDCHGSANRSVGGNDEANSWVRVVAVMLAVPSGVAANPTSHYRSLRTAPP